MDTHIATLTAKEAYYPFLGDALWWLTVTATTKDVNSIKTHVNQLIKTLSAQQEILVHMISILNVTRYAAQINRHSINVLMDKMGETCQDVHNLYNSTTSLATSLSYHQIVLHIRSVLANLRESLSHIKVSTHTMDNMDIATTGTLLPHILPIMDLKKMLSHIEETLPSTLHLPVSSKDTLHFYCYLCTHVWLSTSNFFCSSMYQFRIGHNSLPSTIFLHWTFHMVILLPAMMSTLSTLGSHRMKPWQWKFLHNNSGFVKKQMDSFVQSLHCSNHLQTHHLALLPYMSKIQPASWPDVPYKSGNLQMLVCPHNLPPMFGYWQQHPQQQEPQLHSYTHERNTVYCSKKTHPHTMPTHSL